MVVWPVSDRQRMAPVKVANFPALVCPGLTGSSRTEKHEFQHTSCKKLCITVTSSLTNWAFSSPAFQHACQCA